MAYRVMEVNQHDLSRYQINKLSMTKWFWSSSIQKEIAAWFLTRQQTSHENSSPRTRHKTDGTKIKIWVMCIYQIRHPRTALHIENISQYTAEKQIPMYLREKLLRRFILKKLNNTARINFCYSLSILFVN